MILLSDVLGKMLLVSLKVVCGPFKMFYYSVKFLLWHHVCICVRIRHCKGTVGPDGSWPLLPRRTVQSRRKLDEHPPHHALEAWPRIFTCKMRE